MAAKIDEAVTRLRALSRRDSDADRFISGHLAGLLTREGLPGWAAPIADSELRLTVSQVNRLLLEDRARTKTSPQVRLSLCLFPSPEVEPPISESEVEEIRAILASSPAYEAGQMTESMWLRHVLPWRRAVYGQVEAACFFQVVQLEGRALNAFKIEISQILRSPPRATETPRPYTASILTIPEAIIAAISS